MSYWSIIKPDTTEFPFDATTGCFVTAAYGAGMPPVKNVVQPYAIADGGYYQRTQVQSRLLTLQLLITGTSEANYRANKQALIDAIGLHRRTTPVEIRFKAGTADLAAFGHYDAGLELGRKRGHTEEVALRFVCPDPYWYGVTDVTGPLAVRQVINNVNLVAERGADGIWSNLDEGVNFEIYCLAYAPNGELYAGGDFTQAGGSAIYRVARWTGAAWLPSGAGLNNTVRALHFRPDGHLYAGGLFTDVEGGPGGTYNRVARWDGAAWNPLGTGLNSWACALAVNDAGDLYVGGSFTTAGGAAAFRVARWDGSGWNALGPGLDGNVYALAIGPDGDLYVGGSFTDVQGGPGFTYNNVARWDGSSWNRLGSGVNSAVDSLAFGADGRLYAGGLFTAAGGVAASRVAVWNGSSWAPLGAGLNQEVFVLHIDEDEEVYAGGMFNYSGDYPLPMRWARWVNPLWAIGEGDIGAAFVRAIRSSGGKLAIGGSFSGNLPYPGITTINNPGTTRAYPIFEFSGPGTLLELRNHTTGQEIDFLITLLDGESVTLDLRPQQKTFTSDFRGNILSTILTADLEDFWLLPGNNQIAAYIDNAGASGSYSFRAPYLSIDGAPA